MDVHLVAPPPDLAPWVVMGVGVALDSPPPGPVPTHLPALVEGGLTVVLEGNFYVPLAPGHFTALPRCLLSGPRASPDTLYRTPRLRCVGLRLHPAGLAALLRDSPVLLPSPANAGDVWGTPWGLAEQQVHEADGGKARIAVLFEFLRARLGLNDRHRERTRRAWRLQSAALNLPGAGAALGLTHRQFERSFQATFGLRPKLFQRIARLEGLLRAAVPSGRTDAQLALEHGYYDQSHLGKELRLLAGSSLSELVDGVNAADERYWPLAVGTGAQRGMSFFS